jgi:hypothetical protein
LPIVAAVDGVIDLASCGVDFVVSTTVGLAIGIAVAGPLVAMLLASGCGKVDALVLVDDSAPTAPFDFRCPEKIIASFLSACSGAFQVAAEMRTN